MMPLVSNGLGTLTTLHPRIIGYHMVTVNPKEWKIGRQAIIVAVSGRTQSEEICQQLDKILRWVSTTPFGSPELPLVNKRPASSRSPRFGRFNIPAIHWLGSTQAASNHGRIAFFPPNALIMSGRSNVFSGQGKSFTLSRTALAVMTVSISPSRRLDLIAAGPAVKFRLTGVLPAHRIAKFAILPPAPGGSTTPMRCSGIVRRIWRESAAAAASNAPALTSRRPTERSTISKRQGRRASPRTTSRPR